MNDQQAVHYLGLIDRALRFARKNLSADVTAQRLLILVAVYFHEGLSQRQLMNHLDSTSITALSRNLADLSRLNTKKLPGPGLLELRTDPLNLRIKRVYLTRKGRSFVKRWLAEIAGKNPARSARSD